MVGAFEVVVAHLAFDGAGKGTQPAWWERLGEDLLDRGADGRGDLVRGKRPRGR
jgi:hypothetical protein